MKFIKAAGSLEKLDSFIEVCYMSGEFQPENAADFLSPTMGFLPLNEENPYAAKVQKIEELAAVLHAKLKATPIVPGDFVDVKASVYIGEFESNLTRLHNDRKMLNDQCEICEEGIEQYRHFISLDARLDELFACEFIKVRFGHMPKESYDKLTAYNDKPYMLFVPSSTDDVDYWGVYFAPHHKSEEIDRIFSLLYFERLHIPGAVGTAQEVIDQLKVNMDILNTQIAELDKKLADYWEINAEKITGIYSRLKWFQDAFDLRRYAACRGNQFYYAGWMPAANLKKFNEGLSKLQDINCEVSDAENQATSVPVKIKNGFFARPFEYFVSMYGLPSYGEADITAFVAVTYTLIFGMMFGDVGQGLVLMIAGFLMWKIKAMPLGKIIIPCGASSMFFGFIFGSVFGFEEALNPIYKALGLASKPLDVMESVNTVLLFSIGIGVFLVTLSMLINVYSCIKSKRFGEALFSNNGVAGIVFYTFGVLAAAGMMGLRINVPKSLMIAGLTVSALLLFSKDLLINLVDKHHGEKIESWTDFVLQNIFEMLEYVLSYLSNTVSFLRVGAFVLVHAGMMMVVFALANDKNIIVIILGNILVVALEGLLTGIQALRLEFYEMFSRFLKGDGSPFIAAGPAVLNKNN
ncbi:MAG: ATPase [Clostridiales bacterium]|nr:ATPase [Clostridiales bacterium]